MKSTEKDYEYLETSPELLKRGLRRITRPKSLDRILKSSTTGKSRITIYLDTDIVTIFKEIGIEKKIGYQTLINDVLRQVVRSDPKESQQSIKDALLTDKKFLKKLKMALTA